MNPNVADQLRCVSCGEQRWYKNTKGQCIDCGASQGETIIIDGESHRVGGAL
jgi:ribosomal protein L37E